MNAREFKGKIKDRAQSSHDKPESLRRELQKDFPVESALELPVAESTRKMVNRVRKAAEEHMPTPKTLPDVGDVPRVLTTTHEVEFFLHFDSGAHDKERVLIFATSCNLETLEDCEKWYCDRTFATSPVVFYQVYTTHGGNYYFQFYLSVTTKVGNRLRPPPGTEGWRTTPHNCSFM